MLVETANYGETGYEVDYCSWKDGKDGIVLYATGNLTALPHFGGEVRQVINGIAVPVETPYQEKLGFFSDLSEVREFCQRMGLPTPIRTNCMPGW